ncbi:MAG: hypothetical protein M1832_003347 [Thelocarpon impressellum]|nr:MAG: hypothetical protein M1832_003347 [Thelocarpon impressellum]
MGLTISETERALQTPGSSQGPASWRSELKESLTSLFYSFVGINQYFGFVTNFQLTLTKDTPSCDTLLFANEIRHDLDSGSIILDACVVPLTHARCGKLLPALSRLMSTRLLGINLSKEETVTWKQMLPALAERCRTWKHRSSCEYGKRGAPLSTEEGENPLCSCGEGQVPAGFGDQAERAPFARYATQVAISPLFAVPHEESFVSQLANVSLPTRTTGSAITEGQGDLKRCGSCGASSKELKECSRCYRASYCDAKCQRAAWKDHKGVCKKP